MAEITYDIQERFGVLSESPKGWRKEFNLISWNGRQARYDLREWSPDGEKMAKGITLSEKDIMALRDMINNLDLVSLEDSED